MLYVMLPDLKVEAVQSGLIFFPPVTYFSNSMPSTITSHINEPPAFIAPPHPPQQLTEKKWAHGRRENKFQPQRVISLQIPGRGAMKVHGQKKVGHISQAKKARCRPLTPNQEERHMTSQAGVKNLKVPWRGP